ncbi:hypothetical protein [Paenibacillus caui]|uniref:hypothetical protein n=1 Tax=Paenibacillus caui TaxID=2873927 RepID=UPI001CA8E584|nr:hypothetical protein [Paenibacillus caui]
MNLQAWPAKFKNSAPSSSRMKRSLIAATVLSLLACLMAAPVPAEAAPERAPEQALIEPGPSFGIFDDSGYESNYIQPTRDGGLLMINRYDDSESQQVWVTFGKMTSSQSVWSDTFYIDSGIDRTRPSRAVIRETADGGTLFLIHHFKREGGNEITAYRLDAAGETLWSKALDTDTLDYIDTRVGLETLPDGGFLVSAQSASGQTFTIYKYNDQGGPLWQKQETGTLSGWLAGREDGFYAVLDTVNGQEAVQWDRDGNEVTRTGLELGGGKSVLTVQKLEHDRIAVTGQGGPEGAKTKSTIILGNRLKVVKAVEDYAINEVYIPEDKIFIRIDNETSSPGEGAPFSYHTVIATGVKSSGKELWQGRIEKQESRYYSLVYDPKLVYKVDEGYAILKYESSPASFIGMDKIIVNP